MQRLGDTGSGIWRRGGKSEDLYLGSSLPWAECAVSPQAVPAGVEDWDKAMSWGKKV